MSRRPSNELTKVRSQDVDASQGDQSPCALCTESGWLQEPGHGNTGHAIDISYHELMASAEKGCDACSLLCNVFQPFALNSAKPIHIWSGRTDVSTNQFSIVWFDLMYSPVDSHDHVTERLTTVHLFTDKVCPFPGIPSEPVEFSISGVGPAACRISDWLDHCYQHHKNTCGTPIAAALPTRILQIEGKDRVRLRDAEIDRPIKAHYACLSHCWGGVQPIKTTTSTLHVFQSNIPWDSLPQTFQDALELTLCLGLRYLWIDSLCIIQDDEDDWRRESSKMASIYASSFLTIAATRSKDAYGGLYGEPSLEYSPSRHTFGEGNSAFSVYVRKEYSVLSFEHSQLPLIQRAWAFQERLLSARVVHFADAELYWECVEEAGCESNSYSLTNFSKTKLMEGVTIPVKGETRQNSQMTSLNDRWHGIVERYCLRSLTYGKDIFPAIEGVARLFQGKLGCAYYAGLWQNNLLHDILWLNNGGATKAVPYRAPSWSWASYHHSRGQDRWFTGASFEGLKWCHMLSPTCEERIRVISVSTEFVGGNPFGEITSGKLELEGRCLRATEKIVGSRTYTDGQGQRTRENVRGLTSLCTDDKTNETLDIALTFDWSYDGLHNDRLVQDILLTEIVRNDKSSASLVLSPVSNPEHPGTFERVGIATISVDLLKDAFQEWGKEMTLIII